MKMASVAEIKARLSSYLKESEKGPIIVTRHGKPVAVLLPVQDEEELERLILAYSERLRAILEVGRQQVRQGEGIPHEDFWQETTDAKPPKGKGKTRGKP